MVAIGQFCQVEPSFRQVQTSIYSRIRWSGGYSFVDYEEWYEYGEVDSSYSESNNHGEEGEGIVALHGR